MDIPGEESTKLPAGRKMKKMLCTSIVSWSMAGCRGRFPRVFGDKFGEKFGEKFGDSLKYVNNFVTNFVTN